MDWKIRQDRQDDRVWCLGVMLRHESFLDTRIYACADYCASAGLTKDANDILAAWEEWKIDNPSDNPQVINRL